MGKLIVGKNDIETLYPELALEWNYDKNGALTPKDITPGSHKKVWWKCPVCNYEWESTIAHVARTDKCPVCNKRKKN